MKCRGRSKSNRNTDGSKMLANVGVCVYSELFAFYASPFRTNFDEELKIRVSAHAPQFKRNFARIFYSVLDILGTVKKYSLSAIGALLTWLPPHILICLGFDKDDVLRDPQLCRL
ncbi:hypothetical protein CEXT_410311 [Caerostris extrusa]|uniref:Uncharacterized protein n=1 Tax=Caerostris extrusa TaxID=172846 RepID=A0AAV4UMB7_CAEEX|nr:hypothetical protein CEXT_410311 [Caerostris extrusa]